MEILFDIGEWVECEDGLAQVLFIRPIYRERYEETKNGEKIGSLRQVNVICKILCDFNGKIRKRSLIRSYLLKHCDKLSKKSLKIIEAIKQNSKIDYQNYLLYDDKLEVGNVIRLRYKVDEKLHVFVKNEINELRKDLLPCFTFKEFTKEFKKRKFPFNLDDFIGYKYEYNRKEIVELVFNNRLYKVKGKEKIFDYIKCVIDE